MNKKYIIIISTCLAIFSHKTTNCMFIQYAFYRYQNNAYLLDCNYELRRACIEKSPENKSFLSKVIDSFSCKKCYDKNGNKNKQQLCITEEKIFLYDDSE